LSYLTTAHRDAGANNYGVASLKSMHFRLTDVVVPAVHPSLFKDIRPPRSTSPIEADPPISPIWPASAVPPRPVLFHEAWNSEVSGRFADMSLKSRR
jgi:hypothetical protein